MTATRFRHLNEQGYKFSMIQMGISSHVRYLLEEKDLYKNSGHAMACFFFSTSVANEIENLNIWFKLNQRAKIP